MSTNKKFRIQNGVDVVGELSINDVTVIGADGKVVAGAIQEAVAELTAADIADLQSQVTAILGTSPETLDTLQEIVTAFQDADTNLVASVASNSSDIATINATLTSGVATPADVAALEETIGDTALLPPAPPTFDGRLVVQSKSGPSDYPEAIHIYDPENPTTPISIVNPAVDGEHAWDRFGESVAQSGSVLAVASPEEESDSGSSSLGVVWIYDTNDLSAAPTAVTPPKTNTGFGATGSIALSSTHLFVGAPWWYTPSTRQEFMDLGDYLARSLESPGAVLIYSLADLSADPVILHSDSPSSSGSSTGFGYSVNVSNNKLIVGSINDLVANGGSSTDDENTAPHGGGSATIFDISGGVSSLTSSSYSHKLTAQSSAPGWKNFGKFSFVDGDDLWLSTGSPSYGSAGTTYNLPVGNVGGSIHKFSLSNTTSTPIVSFTSSDFSNGGGASDYFGDNIAFTDTHVVISAQGQENSGDSMSGFVYLYDKSSGNKSSLNFPPSHVTKSAEFGRSIAVVDDELYVTRYVTYGQDTNTSNATPNGNGEVWVYNANNLSSTPTALYEANVNSNEEFGLSLHTIGMPVASVGQLTVAQSINELQSEIVSLSSLQSGDTSSLTSAIATAKSEAISTAAADATTKADQAEADAKAYADQVVAATVDAAPAALDTLNELSAALGDDANFASTVTASIATKASQVDHDAEVARATAAEQANAAAIAAANARTSGLSTSSGSTDIEMTANVTLGDNNITDVNDIYAARGFIDTVESNDLKVQTGTADFEGSIVNFGSATITGSGFSTASNNAVDNHINVSTANAGEFVKWTGTDYEWTDLVSGRLATDQLQIASGGSIEFTGPGGTLDVQNATVHFGGSDVIVDTPTSASHAANKSYVDGVVASTVDAAPAALDTLNELAAALGDDANFSATVATSIGTKASQVDHDAEVAARIAGDSAESSARSSADATLQSNIDALSGVQSGDKSNLQAQINSEVIRATAAEAANAANIVSETSARSSADAALESDIIGLQSQVSTIIQGSPASLDTLVEIVSAFETADASLSGVITANGGRLTTAENNITALQTDLDAEESARGAGDASLQSQINALTGTTDSDTSSLQSQLTAEIARATAAEGVNASAISSETSRATAAEAGLSSDIVTEAATRIAADDAEISARTIADAALQSAIDAEVVRATGAEAGLQSAIDFVKQNTDPAALDSLTEIVAAFQNADSNISGVVSSNTTRIGALESGLTVVEGYTTDNISEGSVNKYWTEQRTKDCLTGGLCISYNSSTGEIAIDEAEVASSLKTAESFASDDADKLDGQQGTFYRINVYDVNGSLVN